MTKWANRNQHPEVQLVDRKLHPLVHKTLKINPVKAPQYAVQGKLHNVLTSLLACRTWNPQRL